MYVRGTNEETGPVRPLTEHRGSAQPRPGGRPPERDAPWYRGDRFPLGSPNTPRNARLLVGAALADWRLLPLLDDAVYCVNELVINAVQHAVGPASARPRDRTVTVAARYRRPWEVVLEVGDDDPRFPGESEPMADDDELAQCGRGLSIVRTLADELGWTRTAAGGKLVIVRFAANRRTGDGPGIAGDLPTPVAVCARCARRACWGCGDVPDLAPPPEYPSARSAHVATARSGHHGVVLELHGTRREHERAREAGTGCTDGRRR